MEIQRQLQLGPLLAKKSFFLFGPRATGKTTLVRQQLAEKAFIIDLLDSRYFRGESIQKDRQK
jgi:predicted AAA+ superfamily ATPase